MQRFRILRILIASVVCSPLAAFAQGAAGNWELGVTLPQGPSTMTMTLTPNGGAVTGTSRNAEGWGILLDCECAIPRSWQATVGPA